MEVAGKGYISKSGNGIILKLDLPTSVFTVYLTCSRQEVKDVLENKKAEFKISQIGEK
jgi:hypothetical protein